MKDGKQVRTKERTRKEKGKKAGKEHNRREHRPDAEHTLRTVGR